MKIQGFTNIEDLVKKAYDLHESIYSRTEEIELSLDEENYTRFCKEINKQIPVYVNNDLIYGCADRKELTNITHFNYAGLKFKVTKES